MFYQFTQTGNVLEFDKGTKIGNLYKISLYTVIESTPIKTPSSWHSSEFKMIVMAYGERSTFMILMEEEQKQFVVLCDFRLHNNVIWFTALHSTEYSLEDQIIDI